MTSRALVFCALLALAVFECSHDVGLGPLLSVRIGGCADFVRGNVCELQASARRLRILVETTPEAEVFVRVDKQLAQVGGRESGLFDLEVPPSAQLLQVFARSAAGTSIVRIAVPTAVPAADLDEANRLRQRGQFARAQELLDAVPATAAPRVLARATGLKARIKRVWPAKDLPGTVAMFRQAIAQDRISGRVLGELSDRIALAYTLFSESKYAEVRSEMSELLKLSRMPEDSDDIYYHRGLLEMATQNRDGALRDLREAIRRSDAMARPALKQQAVVPLIELLQYVGRHAEALEYIRYLETSTGATDPACRRAETAHNIGWFLMNAVTSTGPTDPRAGRSLELAAALYRNECADPSNLSQSLVALAMMAVIADDPRTARAQLAASRKDAPADPPARLARRWAELDARIALAERDWQGAEAAFRRLTLLGAAAASAMDEWRGEVGRGQALEGSGALDAAASAYESAEDALDRAQAEVPLGQGRSTFAEQHQLSASLLVDLLARQNRLAEALRVGRRSRARALRSLRSSVALDQGMTDDSRQLWDNALQAYHAARVAIDAEASGDWKLSDLDLSRALARRAERIGDMNDGLYAARARLAGSTRPQELTSPRPDEAVILFHPAKQGWLGIAVQGETSVARWLPSLAAVPASGAPLVWMRPFVDVARGASAIRLLPYGAAEGLDFEGAVKALDMATPNVAVLYGLDVEGRGADAAGRRAVVVADPRGDLPEARREAATVSSALATRGWSVTVLDHRSARLSQLKELLQDPEVGWFHYAGHGVYAGTDGLDSELPLADGEALRTGDILSMKRVPPQVVLAGCNTAGPGGGVVMLSVAHAFVLAGAQAVLGTHDRIKDEATREMVTQMYARQSLDPAANSVKAPEGNTQFRVLVP